MKKLFIVLALTLGLVSSSLMFTQPVDAQSLFGGAKKEACSGANVGSSDDCKSDAAGDTISRTIANIINILSTIIGIVAVVMIIINGFKMITSNGDSNAINSARTGIIYALVGLVIVALAQFIVRFVLSKV